MRNIRVFWWRRIRRWDGELCQRCGRKYFATIWSSPDELWDELVRDRFRLLCPACFDGLAITAGILLRWRPEIDS